MKIIPLPFLIILILAFSACDKNRVYEKNIMIHDASWDRNNILEFDTEINDLTLSYNFFVNIRNTTNYKDANIYFFISTTFPSGEVAHDTLECFLADVRGKWLGRGYGKMKESHILFKSRFRFPQAGRYKFEVEQGMRVDTLYGITDMGIRIEKAEQLP
ncbi:MAG: gliding motility lipoprotein GldH [Bacteroidales bacterium]|nr:gliding motility lipoprotein GldH [Bacteroidales bacterium]